MTTTTGSAELTQDDQEPLAAPTAFVHNGKLTPGFCLFTNGGPVSIGAKTQTLTAYPTVEAELIMAVHFEGRMSPTLSNVMITLSLKS